MPPPGDGKFDHLDIIAALSSGLYLTGLYNGQNSVGRDVDRTVQVIYDGATGELAIGGDLGWSSVSIQSRNGILVADDPAHLNGIFDFNSNDQIFKATFGASFGPLSFGPVARAGLSEDFIRDDLTVDGTLAVGGRIHEVKLIYVPEPSGLFMLVTSITILVGFARRGTASTFARSKAMNFGHFVHVLLGLFAVQFALGTAHSAPIEVRTVALTNTPAPGTASGFHTFADGTLQPPSINSAGDITFRARLLLSAPQTHEGIWAEHDQELSLIARKGDLAIMDTVAVDFYGGSSLTIPQIIDDGRVAFIERSTGGILLGGPSSLQLIVGTANGLPIPLPDPFEDQDAVFGGATSFAISPEGRIAFHGEVTREGEGGWIENIQAIWTGTSEDIQLLVQQGDHAPGFPEDITFGYLSQPVINSSGQVAFFSQLREGPINSIWMGTPGSLSLIASTGDLAPGTDNQFFTDFRQPSINDRGEVVFVGMSTGHGDNGVWKSNGNSFENIAINGQEITASAGQATLDHFMAATLNSHGDVVFKGVLAEEQPTGAPPEGAWIVRDGQLHTLALEGETALGGGDESKYFASTDLELIPQLSGTGHIFFQSQLVDGRLSFRPAIFAFNRAGEFLQVIQGGDQFEVAPGDVRTVRHVRMLVAASPRFQATTVPGSGTEDGMLRAINDQGQLAFSAVFEDGTEGVFVSQLPSEPPALRAGDANQDLKFDQNDIGEVWMDTSDEVALTSIHVSSLAGVFTAQAGDNLGGALDIDTDSTIFKATFGSDFSSLSFGSVAQPGLSEEFMLGDLTVVGSLVGGGGLGEVDLVYVREPRAFLLLLTGLVVLTVGCQRTTATECRR